MIQCDRPLQAIHLNGSVLSGSIENKNTESFIRIKTIQPQPTPLRPHKERQTKCESDRVIKGVRGLAAFLSCGTNKAQQIMNSGILVSEKIAYKIGRTWGINREKLTVLLEENPRIFEKLPTES